MKSLWIGMVMTFFTMFDVPVFWPILLLYWLLLFTVTMKRQIKHMIKYRYLPFTTGKKVSGSVFFEQVPAYHHTQVPDVQSSRYY